MDKPTEHRRRPTTLGETLMIRQITKNAAVSMLATFCSTASIAQAQPPQWAYPVNPPGFKAAADDGSIRRVPGSSVGYTLTQTRDRFMASNWHPNDYPPLPAIVASGRKPDVFACGYCHRANGSGGPENANIAGLPAQYIINQMKLFQTGERRSAVPSRMPVVLKSTLAKAISDDEIRVAADYFASLNPVSNVRVVEADMAPVTQVAGWILATGHSAGLEAIDGRIVETPNDLEQFEVRDSRVQFTAYVPRGSIARGKALAAGLPSTGTQACAKCHGVDLRGVDLVPPLAGRSPSYLMRQLVDFQSGLRGGTSATDMKPVVASLSTDNMRDLVAYLASLPPVTTQSSAVAQ